MRERERELLLGTSNMKYVEGVDKFGEKIQKLSQGQLATILHNFGTSSYFTKRRQGLPATTMRRVEKATISVQTESLKKVQCSFRNHKALPQESPPVSFDKRWLPEKGNISSLQIS